MEPRTTAIVLTTLLILAGRPAAGQTGNPFEVDALDAAKEMAHADIAGLRIILTGARPAYVSEIAEAWTVRDAVTGQGVILVFTGSQTFRCAMWPHRNYQCTLKLASILTHEAWHLRFGATERQAYDQQLIFLELHGGSAELRAAVRLARRYVTQ